MITFNLTGYEKDYISIVGCVAGLGMGAGENWNIRKHDKNAIQTLCNIIY